MWQGFAGAVGGSVIGGGLDAWGQSQANRWNVAEAAKNREFQERMSSTSHQREVEDLRKAGLNPILSAGGGGASSPSGAMPNIRSIAEGASASATGVARMAADLGKIKADTALSKQQTKNTKANEKLIDASLPGVEAQSISAQADSFSAHNRWKAEAKDPKYWGEADAYLRRLGFGFQRGGVRFGSSGGKR